MLFTEIRAPIVPMFFYYSTKAGKKKGEQTIFYLCAAAEYDIINTVAYGTRKNFFAQRQWIQILTIKMQSVFIKDISSDRGVRNCDISDQF